MKCLSCQKPILKKRNKFCNNKCQSDFNYTNYIEKWLRGEVNGSRGEYYLSKHIRRYLFEKNQSKCQICGWNEINESTGMSPLEVHHIDGNSTNNRLDNLQLLCPNCHSLTETYKSLNSCSSRLNRESTK